LHHDVVGVVVVADQTDGSMGQLRQPDREVDVGVGVVGEPALTALLTMGALIEPPCEREETMR